MFPISQKLSLVSFKKQIKNQSDFIENPLFFQDPKSPKPDTLEK